MSLIHPHQVLAKLRRVNREVEDLTQRFTDTGSKRALADLNGVRLALARVQKTLQTDVNARKKLRELHAAQLNALKIEESMDAPLTTGLWEPSPEQAENRINKLRAKLVYEREMRSRTRGSKHGGGP